MKLQPKKVNIIVKLEDNFLKKLRLDIEDEIKIASKKWRVNLNNEDRNNIVLHSFNQLFQKVSEITKNTWSGDEVIEVRLNTKKDIKDIEVSKGLKLDSDLRLLKLRDRWEIAYDDSEETIIPINEFYDYLTGKIRQWARTAAFYGVSSYT